MRQFDTVHCMFINAFIDAPSPSTDDDGAVEDRVAHPAAQRPPDERGVAALAGQRRRARPAHSTSGSNTVRLAGSPGSIGRPWRSATPAIAAGFHDSAATTSASGMSRWASAHAERRLEPEHPRRRLVERLLLVPRAGAGAWSVAMASIVPSASPAVIAATSAVVRSGGLTLNTAS